VRFLIIAALALISYFAYCPAPAHAQENTNRRAARGWAPGATESRTTEKKQQPQSAATAPAQSRTENIALYGNPVDTLTQEQILRRIARLYGYQARLMVARAESDEDAIEQAFEDAMADLAILIHQDRIMEHSSFRELYRSVITEYEQYYGVTDSLGLQRGDIFDLRDELFTHMDTVDAPMLEDVNLPPQVRVAEAVFPMTMNRLVESSISFLLRNPDRHLYRWLSRAETYFPMIEQILAEEGVPDELKYLAMIESGLNPTARSWAQAGGIWQFITATGRAYGLQVNQWVDERNDPEKATRAAARHLKDLHRMFGGDWQLALAGYNCSPARIRRAMNRAEARLGRTPTFWDIYNDIPAETKNYVPMFIATALVASNPDAFNLRQVEPGPQYTYDLGPVPRMVSLNDIARLANTDVNTLRALNPELQRQMTPPGNGSYQLRFPTGHYTLFAAAANEKPLPQQTTTAEYTVRRGDTLGKIATQYGTSVSALVGANNLSSTTVRVGQKLNVPTNAVESSPVIASVSASDAMTISYGRRNMRAVPIPTTGATLPAVRQASAVNPQQSQAQSRTPVAAANLTTSGPAPAAAPARSTTNTSSAAARNTTRVVYRVRNGDNLTAIATRYGVTVQQIREWNNLRGSTIRVGQNLTIHTGGGTAAAASTQPEPASATTRATGSTASSSTTYTVRRGDTLGSIASAHGVTVNQIREWNSLRNNTIQAGQRLRIEGGSTVAAAKVTTHRVQRGENLTQIANRYGVTVQQIREWNNLRNNTIQVGQNLQIRS
jgi:membrane-bound lytic murein transglycosylase D